MDRERPRPANRLPGLCLLLTVGVALALVVTAGAVPTEFAASSAPVLQLDALQDFIERLDRFLEAVLDLVNTIRALFGG